jgi:hypothetical protein
VLDTALTRAPGDRYQTVAKFAADVASVTGVTRGATRSVPHTRSGADAKTQLLEAPAKPRRRLSPAMIGAVAAVAAASAASWAVFANGNGTVQPDSSAVSHDTAGVRANPQTGESRQTFANRDTGPRMPPLRRGIDPARAGDSLNTLFDRIDDVRGAILRDAALDIYNASGVSEKDKAMAAYLVANGFSKLNDQPKTCEWAGKAVTHDGAARAYQALRQSTCGS